MMTKPDGVTVPGIPAVIMANSTGFALMNAKNKIYVTITESEPALQKMYNHSNLYVSDDKANRFTVSLKDVLNVASKKTDSTNYKGYVDVVKVESLDGTYIANYYDGIKNAVQTVITYDKGGFWHALTCSGSTCGADAKGDKPLTLALAYANAQSGLPEPHTTASAQGIILANGWIGEQTAVTGPSTPFPIIIPVVSHINSVKYSKCC